MRKLNTLIIATIIVLSSVVTSFAGEYTVHHDVYNCECDYTAKELACGLKYELVDNAKDYISAQENYGICPIYNVAKDALESGWGRHAYQNNLGGAETDLGFESQSEFIDWWSAFQLENYLMSSGAYYGGGTTIANINEHYNGREFWQEEVVCIMNQIVTEIEENKPETVVVEF